jgi:hypothetical protein
MAVFLVSCGSLVTSFVPTEEAFTSPDIRKQGQQHPVIDVQIYIISIAFLNIQHNDYDKFVVLLYYDE